MGMEFESKFLDSLWIKAETLQRNLMAGLRSSCLWFCGSLCHIVAGYDHPLPP